MAEAEPRRREKHHPLWRRMFDMPIAFKAKSKARRAGIRARLFVNLFLKAHATPPERIIVNRRSIGTPDQRAKGTPFELSQGDVPLFGEEAFHHPG